MLPFQQNLTHAWAGNQAIEAQHPALRQQAGEALATLLRNPSPELASILHQATREDDLMQIETHAARIRAYCTDLVVIGMGGSSLSAEVFAGFAPQSPVRLHVVDHIDSPRFQQLFSILPWNTTHLLFISKSGTTIELMAGLAVLLEEGKKRSIDLAKQCSVITMENANPLAQFSKAQGIPMIAHDAALCGRFSLLSAVGLLPAAVLGIEIRTARAGARRLLKDPEAVADAVAVHCAHHQQGAKHQVVMVYNDVLVSLAQWYRQCWAESLGKHSHASTPIVSRGPCDQHSQLQLYLAGPRDKFFTSLVYEGGGQGIRIPDLPVDHPAKSVLRGKYLTDLVACEQRATHETLVAEGCPLRTWSFAALDVETLGAVTMQTMLEIALFAALLGINAYDQPAVEASKRLTMEFLRNG